MKKPSTRADGLARDMIEGRPTRQSNPSSLMEYVRSGGDKERLGGVLDQLEQEKSVQPTTAKMTIEKLIDLCNTTNELIEEALYGSEEGYACTRTDGEGNICKGLLEYYPDHPEMGCSCHINPPCSYCTDQHLECPKCGWKEESIIHIINDHVVSVNKDTGVLTSHGRRKLDNTKIDYYINSHSNSSQICEGVYPKGTTRAEVLKKVDGTFGGRWESFGNGKFKFIAYTD